MKKLCLSIAIAMVSCIGLFATSASAANRTVNCNEGQSIQDAVEKGKGSAAPLYIDVSGSCEEVVTITRDDVTIVGDEAATVTGKIVTSKKLRKVCFGEKKEEKRRTLHGILAGTDKTSQRGLQPFDTNNTKLSMESLHLLSCIQRDALFHPSGGARQKRY